MLNSVIARLAFFCALALMILAVPVYYFTSAEKSSLTSENTESTVSYAHNTAPSANEDPIVQLASLTVSPTTPTFEILEPLGALPSDTKGRVEAASNFAKEQRFDEALSTLEGVHFEDRDDYSVKFLEARILAWAGQHKQAEQEFDVLSRKYPKDLDVMLSYGYLQFYQRNYAASEKLFIEVLNLNPDYNDAKLGLERARQAQKKL